MKRYLKFLLLPVLASTPAMLVVACSENVEISNKDVLNAAIGRMQSHTFDMTKIKLQDLPKDKYNDLSKESRNAILTYYAGLVTNGTTWDYPNVSVSIEPKSKDEEFIQKYGKDVDAKITLIANLDYKGLHGKKEITVRIINDTTTNQAKIDAIGQQVEKELNNQNLVFEFQDLLPDNLTNEDAVYDYAKIASQLKDRLIKDEILDYPGIELKAYSNDKPDAVIYQLDDKAININQKTVNGTIGNLKIQLSVADSEGTHDIVLKDKQLKIQQKIIDTNNQIATILNQPADALKFYNDELVGKKLPKDGQLLNDYDANKEFQKKVTDRLFSEISKVYPTTKMGISEFTWDSKLVTITNAESSGFILDSTVDNAGYFLVDIGFVFGDNKTPIITTSFRNLQINLIENN